MHWFGLGELWNRWPWNTSQIENRFPHCPKNAKFLAFTNLNAPNLQDETILYPGAAKDATYFLEVILKDKARSKWVNWKNNAFQTWHALSVIFSISQTSLVTTSFRRWIRQVKRMFEIVHLLLIGASCFVPLNIPWHGGVFILYNGFYEKDEVVRYSLTYLAKSTRFEMSWEVRYRFE